MLYLLIFSGGNNGRYLFWRCIVLQNKYLSMMLSTRCWGADNSCKGRILITIYSIHIKDIVFTVASFLSFAIYIRNLVLIYKDRKKTDKEV